MKTALVLSTSLFAAAVIAPIHVRASAPGPANPQSGSRASGSAGAGDGAAILNRACTSCHDKSQATQPRPAADWRPILERMRDNGANISDADANILLAYLTKNYSRK